MTFDEAVAKCKQIKSYAIGLPVKGEIITSLFIGPTNWNRMCEYMNAQNNEGREIAVIKFANESFSVYGISVDNSYGFPSHSLILLDNIDKMMGN